MRTKKNTDAITKSEGQILYDLFYDFSKREFFTLSDIVQIFNRETTKILARLDPDTEISYEIDEDKKVINVYNLNAIVCDDEEEDEILLSLSYVKLAEAKLIDSKIQEGDTIKKTISLKEVAKYVEEQKASNILKAIHASLIQAISTLKKKKIFDKYKDRIGEKVQIQFSSKNKDGSWNVQIIDEGDLTISAYLPSTLISSKRKINPGNFSSAIIESVEEETRLSQIQVSLDSPKMVIEMIKREIPEVADGLINIVKVTRQPGERTKVAIAKNTDNYLAKDIDEYGSIIGQNAARIKTISDQLDGEAIDIIAYDNDIKRYISNAMAPGKIFDVVSKNIVSEKQMYFVIVEKDNATLAIGRKGINVKLASELVGVKIDVITTEEARTKGIVFDGAYRSAARAKNTVDSQFSPRYRDNNSTKRNNKFNNINVVIDSFDSDVRAFKEQEENQEFNSYEMDFEELFKQHMGEISSEESDEMDSEAEDNKVELTAEQEKKVAKESKSTAEDYKRIKETLKDFKVDDDLKSFGLDNDFDLSDFDDEDWN
ncbi:hypothetical protein [Mycoplasmopsis opalescens]|uniref:hypothetical protein n=1 Tax=Mycoplasmopsis opalescens TaxID=114886 RepID=UPI0004A7797B|nr:hypothetical protein [Mycoplasmopsis opalescens]